jgi:hypothetical protein
LPNHQAKPPRRINLHEYRPYPLQQLTAADRSVKHRQIRTLRIGDAGYGTTMVEDDHVRNWIRSGPIILEDSTAAILIGEGKVSSAGRVKHVDIMFQWLKMAITEKHFLIRYVPSALYY